MAKLHKKFFSIFRRKPKYRRRDRRAYRAYGPIYGGARSGRTSANQKDVVNFLVSGQAVRPPLASRIVMPDTKKARFNLHHGSAFVQKLAQRFRLHVRPGMVLVLVVAVAVGIGVSNWLKGHPLRRVVFKSDFVHITPEVLAPQISGLLDASLFELDLPTIQAKILSVPWVEKVSLRRVWPDALQIAVTEKKVRAKWGKHSFVSDEGEIFTAPLTPAAVAFSAYLPELMGKEDDVKLLLDYYELMSVALAPTGLDIVALTRGSRDWQIILANNINLLVNHAGALDKLVRFRQVYEQLGERQAEVVSADLRYHHGVAITWREEVRPQDNS